MLSTTKITESKSGNFLPKTIQPGVTEFYIREIQLYRMSWMEKDNSYHITLHAETKEIEDFEGFLIDPKNESLGRYKGQIGKIKMGYWPFKDFTDRKGKFTSRDEQIMYQIQKICISCNSDWLEKADGKYETIEDLIAAFNTDRPFDNVLLKAVVACEEFEKVGSEYPGQNLYLPKGEKGKLVFENADAKTSKLIAYNEEEHYKKYVPEEVGEFKGSEEAAPLSTGGLDLDASVDETPGFEFKEL